MSETTKTHMIEQSIKQQLANISGTNVEDWWIISRVRHGMEVVLQTVGQVHGSGEVITQPFTCVTAINPIIASGMTPVYADISAETLSIDFTKIGTKLSTNTRAIVLQHSFGIPTDVEALFTAIQPSQDTKPLIIEDSAHCLGFIARSIDKRLPDVSLHSFGAEKFLNTRYGAAIWVNPAMVDAKLYTALHNSLNNLPKAQLNMAVRVAIYPWLNALLNRLPNVISHKLRQILLHLGALRSPIVPIECQGINYESCQKLSNRQLKNVAKEIARYSVYYEHRLKISKIYVENINAAYIPKALRQNAFSCVRFPIIAHNEQQAQQWFEDLRAQGYFIGKWYRPLIFPGVTNKIYGYQQGSCKVADNVSRAIANLPTGLQITPNIAKEISDAINRTGN